MFTFVNIHFLKVEDSLRGGANFCNDDTDFTITQVDLCWLRLFQVHRKTKIRMLDH